MNVSRLLVFLLVLVLTSGCAIYHKARAQKRQQELTSTSTTTAGSVFPVRGITKCAHCEYDLRPLGDAKSDGLAVLGDSGEVYIVEAAEQDYPDLFENRLDDVAVVLDGEIIQSIGRIHWVRPRSLRRASATEG